MVTRDDWRAGVAEWLEVHDLTLSIGLPSTAYSQNDILADFQKVNNVAIKLGGASMLQSIVLQNDDANNRAIDIVLANSAISLGTENSAITIGDSTAHSIVGTVNIAAADYDNYANSYQATIMNIGLPVQCADTTTAIWVGAVYRDATGDTYTAGGTRLKLGFAQGM